MQQRKAKESEKKSDKKNQDEEDSSASTVKRTALQTSAGSRDSVKPGTNVLLGLKCGEYP